MGLLDFFKKKDTTNGYTYAKMLNGTTPVFSSFGEDVYASDVVQQSINCVINEMKKLQPTHILKQAGFVKLPNSRVDIQNALNNPNPLMSTADLITRIMWQLFLSYNAWVYPIWENGKLKELYPLNPKTTSFFENDLLSRNCSGIAGTLRYV